MATRGRYKSLDNWRRGEIDFVPYGVCRDVEHLVTLDICDVQDDRGNVWHDGCHRITVKGPKGRPRSKTFIGEMAWSEAQRYGSDAIHKLTKLLREQEEASYGY